MTALSYKPAGTKGFVLAASPIYPIENTSAQLVFEVLASDAVVLQRLLGSHQYFYCEEDLFWGRVVDLEPGEPSHPTLQFLAKPVLRTRITKYPGPQSVN